MIVAANAGRRVGLRARRHCELEGAACVRPPQF
jgi:hypothetical protein